MGREKIRKTARILQMFILGLIGGGLALAASLVSQGTLNELNFITLYLKSSRELIIPALTEEFFKALLTVIIFRKISLWGVGGVGLGFGIVENLISGTASLTLPLVHLLFTLIGFILARKITKRRASKIPMVIIWIIISTAIHWGYNAIVLNFFG